MKFADVDQVVKDQKDREEKRKSNTLIEGLANAINGSDEREAKRIAEEFNNYFGTLVRASVDVESVQGGATAKSAVERKDQPVLDKAQRGKREKLSQVIPVDDESDSDGQGGKRKKHARETSPPSSEDPDVKKRRGKKKKKNASRKKHKSPISSSSSDHSSDSSSSGDSSTEDSSDEEDAELCYEITEFESADLPDLPDKWDKGFRKLRSYVPLTLFNTALLESLHDDEEDMKQKEKSAKLKSSLKSLERQLTYGDFIEMCDLEERYAREIYGLETYADYVVKHKKIVSDLKKTYNCWMIGLRYHLKVRTVIFRRRKLIKSKVRGKTVVKDKVKIPNGLQPLVERQARHDADRAGDLQHTDNPYAPGGVKFGFSFSTGRPSVSSQSTSIVERPTGEKQGQSVGHRGKRGGLGNKPYVKRPFFGYPRMDRFSNQLNTYQCKLILSKNLTESK